MPIVRDEALARKLIGKTILVTGANQDIGLETARTLYATGTTIFLGVRSLEKGKQALEDIAGSENSDGKDALHVIQMSLDNLDSVRKGVQDFLAKSGGRLNILILNAGVMNHAKTKTEDGF
ncbi:retinol dehydrogenase 12 [Colletotrichum spaethianum]|uniref:Retinol dehydrogenase 12 n=1 Tax=Colletotrichum spaethianum TaxID=700344 RepID=A0AA37LED4_9PEZI|nr:retinol dehydrogenase 12 [Colletotrichum spaethianum]GKT46786.1 retinol dehydrogenase 12 [Colletotrichum spaethianum]